MIALDLIGIGTGHPGHVTLEGMQALRDAGAVDIRVANRTFERAAALPRRLLRRRISLSGNSLRHG